MPIIKIVAFNIAGMLVAVGVLLMLQGGYLTGALLWLLGLVANIIGAVLR